MVKKQGGYISINERDKHNSIREEFRGETFDELIKFPKGLGAKHPFNFEDLEKVYKKYGALAGGVNKITSSVVTDFKIKLKNPNAQKIIDDFLHDTNFHTVTNTWVREGILKGNGFIEIDLEETKVRVMNANHMFVKRNKKGKVIEYNQWIKPLNKFNRDSKDLISFKPNQIAHLQINKMPNDPYGIGMVWSNERIIENLVKNEQDLQTLTSRKAGQPYHVKVGQPGAITPKGIVDQIKSDLQFLTNSTEWVTDGDIEIKEIEFKGLGKNITETQMYFWRMLLAGLEVPEVLMGSGQLNEGIAKVQLKAYGRKIKSIQNQVADIIEEKIIRPLLRSHEGIVEGKRITFDEVPVFIWELPDEEDITDKLKLYQTYLNTDNISAELRASLEIKIAELLEDEALLAVLRSPMEAQKQAEQDREDEERRKEEEDIPQPEVPGVKPSAQSFKFQEEPEDDLNEVTLIHEFIRKKGNEWCVFSEKGRNFGCFPTKDQAEKRLTQIKRFSKTDITIQEWVDLKEVDGFNYTDYLVKILEVLKLDEFIELKAITESDITNGLLPTQEIEKLKQVLKDGFKNNQTISEIEKNIKDNVKLGDRVTKVGIISANKRPNMIARTETVRLANEGLIKLYNENNIEKVSFLAALSDRTCPICEGLNGTVFTIKESNGVIPVHVNCRCTWISITE